MNAVDAVMRDERADDTPLAATPSRLAANGLEFAVDVQGPARAPAVVLIMGLGAQYLRWPQVLVDRLVADGFRVLRFDNRDCGESTWLDVLPVPRFSESPFVPPYTVADMAADVVGLLDALGLGAAHVVGASLGGAVAQHLAADHAFRVRSLTSIMSSSGATDLPPPTPAATASLWSPLPRPPTEDAVVADAMRRFAVVASPAYPTPPAEQDRLFRTEFRRGFNPAGVARQLGALLADGDRRPLLARIAVPTVVVHGADDPLIPPAHGEDVAAHVAGAELRLVPGMGHDFPAALAPVIAAAIGAAAARSAGGNR